MTIDSSVFDRYVGTYEIEPGFHASFTVEANQLQIYVPGQPVLNLYPSSETEFFARMTDLRAVFNLAPDGNAESVTLVHIGQKIVAPRIN